MKNTEYDFQTVIERKNTNCLKWDLFDDDLPMWVADMDFRVAPAIENAIMQRANHPIYGYTVVHDELFEAYINWWDRRYGLKMQREDMAYSIGVMPSISSMIRCLTDVGDEILIQTPVYHVFFYVIEDNNRKVLENQLIYENGEYRIDFEDLDKKLSKVKMMILCNPHNPVGKIWSEGDLDHIGRLCKKHDVILISDEIHCDITLPGRSYTPFAEVSESARRNSITCMSASKAFNLAGLHSAAVMIPNPHLRQRISRGLNNEELAESGTLGALSAVLALTRGREWLLALRENLEKNRNLATRFIRNEIPGVLPVPAEATYLLWADIGNVTPDDRRFAAFLRKETGLRVSPGSGFGNAGRGFIRINLACPEVTLMDGLERLREGTGRFLAEIKNRE